MPWRRRKKGQGAAKSTEKERGSVEIDEEENLECTSASMNLKGEPRCKGSFFACYLLCSLNPRTKGRTYIGFTVHPARRLRQHNGQIKCGAIRTRQLRPLEMVMLVYGFPTQVHALQFEWAWQHPTRSLVVREVAAGIKGAGGGGVRGRVLLAHHMLTLPKWASMPLSVLFTSSRNMALQSKCPELPRHMKTHVGPLEEELPCYAPGAAPLAHDDYYDNYNNNGKGDDDDDDDGRNSGEDDDVARGGGRPFFGDDDDDDDDPLGDIAALGASSATAPLHCRGNDGNDDDKSYYAMPVVAISDSVLPLAAQSGEPPANPWRGNGTVGHRADARIGAQAKKKTSWGVAESAGGRGGKGPPALAKCISSMDRQARTPEVVLLASGEGEAVVSTSRDWEQENVLPSSPDVSSGSPQPQSPPSFVHKVDLFRSDAPSVYRTSPGGGSSLAASALEEPLFGPTPSRELKFGPAPVDAGAGDQSTSFAFGTWDARHDYSPLRWSPATSGSPMECWTGGWEARGKKEEEGWGITNPSPIVGLPQRYWHGEGLGQVRSMERRDERCVGDEGREREELLRLGRGNDVNADVAVMRVLEQVDNHGEDGVSGQEGIRDQKGAAGDGEKGDCRGRWGSGVTGGKRGVAMEFYDLTESPLRGQCGSPMDVWEVTPWEEKEGGGGREGRVRGGRGGMADGGRVVGGDGGGGGGRMEEAGGVGGYAFLYEEEEEEQDRCDGVDGGGRGGEERGGGGGCARGPVDKGCGGSVTISPAERREQLRQPLVERENMGEEGIQGERGGGFAGTSTTCKGDSSALDKAKKKAPVLIVLSP